MVQVSGLFIYPVKSLRGHAVTAAELDALGFAGDRRFLIVDPGGRFLTQRTVPRMAQIDTRLGSETLTLSADGAGRVTVPRASNPHAPMRSVTVWKSEGLVAEDCGNESAAWLGSFLGFECRLVRIGEKFSRPVLKSGARPGDVFTFADACPFLAIGEASLADLNDRIAVNGGEPVPIGRFRPNIVVTGCDAFAEDAWARVRIGEIDLRSAGQSTRCIITTTDQFTGARGKEPLRTLARFRRDKDDPTDVNFGVNLIHETKHGTLRVGDAVELL
jgi:uncharacterized protein YcbX